MKKNKCKLHKSCNSCTFCVMEWATAKERCKLRCRKWPNKACEKYFFCKSACFCSSCDKCPQCCRRSCCGDQAAKILVSLCPKGFESQSSFDLKGGVQASVLKIRPPLTRVPVIRSGHANPLRNSYRASFKALHSLLQKQAVGKVKIQSFLAFYNRLFTVPKPNQKWRPILDLSTLNWFLKVKTFKMETPERIQQSLQESWSLHWISVMPTFTSLSVPAQGNIFSSVTRTKLSSFGLSRLVSLRL